MSKRMNKILSFVLICLLLMLSAGCASNSSGKVNSNLGNSSSGKVDVEELARRRAEAESKAAALAAKAKGNQVSSANKNPQSNVAQAQDTAKVDIDLTVLSPIMLLAEVQNMADKYSEYAGKVVKINGRFDSYTLDESGHRIYKCVLSDACCSFEDGVGLLFELNGEHNYPEDYPEIQAPITVTGRFGALVEGEYAFAGLLYSEMVF